MDSTLQYKKHIAKTATKGLCIALALKRLRMLSLLTARQLFNITVVLVIDYALNAWMHAAKGLEITMLNKV